MPRSKPCPACGDLAEVRTYVTAERMEGRSIPDILADRTGDLDVWECECGWAEDVEP